MEIQEISSNDNHYIKTLLKNAGMPAKKLEAATLKEWGRGLSTIYRLEIDHETYWLKFSHVPGSNGSFFIKHLVSPDKESIKHGEKRRETMRKLLLGVNQLAGKHFVAPPASFDEKGETYEYSIGKDAKIAHLARTHMTLWKNLSGNKPKCFTANIWDPCEYPPETVRTLVTALWTLQKLGQQWMKGHQEIHKCLAHENRRLIGYETLADAFQKLTVDQNEMQKIKAAIAKELGLNPNIELAKLGESFLDKQSKNLGNPQSFAEAVFIAEREKLWPKESLYLGRRIVQLMVAEEIAAGDFDIEKDLKKHDQKVKAFPKGIVHQDAHPAQFLIEGKQANVLDLNNVSYDVAFADIANVYVYKIVRGFATGKIQEKQAIELLNATLIPEWIQGYGEDLLSHTVVSFSNTAMSLAKCASLNEEDVWEINLVVNMKSFQEELNKRLQYDRIYREQLFPKLKVSR